MQPDTYEYNSLLLLDDVDDDDEDDDGFNDELDEKQTNKKFSLVIRIIRIRGKGVTYETVLFTLNTLTVPSEHVEASLLPYGLHSMSVTGVECSFSSHS